MERENEPFNHFLLPMAHSDAKTSHNNKKPILVENILRTLGINRTNDNKLVQKYFPGKRLDGSRAFQYYITARTNNNNQ